MILFQEYIRRRDENTAEYNRQIATNSFDPKKFHGFDAVAGELSRSKLASKTHDILAAVILGFLPVLNSKSGTDAMRLDDDLTYSHVELKTSYTEEEKFIKTPKDSVYSVTTNKIVNNEVPRDSTTSIKSNYEAAYKIVNNLDVKNIDTYLLLLDSRTDELIDCRMIEGKVMGDYLNSRKIPSSGNLKVKYTVFEELGTTVNHTCVPIIGFDVWKTKLLPSLPTVRVLPSSTKRKSRSKKNALPDQGSLF